MRFVTNLSKALTARLALLVQLPHRPAKHSKHRTVIFCQVLDP